MNEKSKCYSQIVTNNIIDTEKVSWLFWVRVCNQILVLVFTDELWNDNLNLSNLLS